MNVTWGVTMKEKSLITVIAAIVVLLFTLSGCESPTGTEDPAGPRINSTAANLDDYGEGTPLPETKEDALMILLTAWMLIGENMGNAEGIYDAFDFDPEENPLNHKIDFSYDDVPMYTADNDVYGGFDVRVNGSISGSHEEEGDLVISGEISGNIAILLTEIAFEGPDAAVVDGLFELSAAASAEFVNTYPDDSNDNGDDDIYPESVYIDAEGHADILYALSVSTDGTGDVPFGGKVVLSGRIEASVADTVSEDSFDDEMEVIESILDRFAVTLYVCNNPGEIIEQFTITIDDLIDLFDSFFEDELEE